MNAPVHVARNEAGKIDATRQAEVPAPTRNTARRRWCIGIAAATIWSVSRVGVSGEHINTRGWSSFWKFWSAAVRPTLNQEFLTLTLRAAATTVSFAVVGTVLSTVIGLVGAPLLAQRLWEQPGNRSVLRRTIRTATFRLLRTAAAVPRSVHEIVWALLLVQVFGTDPIVAILAIGIPFGAVSASVFADTIDDAATHAHDNLRAAGAPRLAALTYSIGPTVAADMTGYVFYRFECAIRTAAILGVIGAGGLGFQMQLSFQTLRYSEMWTLIYALVLIAGGADLWSSAIRRRQSRSIARCGELRFPEGHHRSLATPRTHASPRYHDRLLRGSFLALIAAAPVAGWWIDFNPTVLWDQRRQSLMSELIRDMFPPRYGPGGFSGLWSAAVDTAAMSVVAIVVSVALGLLFATFSARPVSAATASARAPRVWDITRRFVVRAMMLVLRAIPPHVWAFLAALILFPGAWPGIVALAAYNTGIMARLFGETLEDVDPRTEESLLAQGARPTARLFYATLPAAAARIIALSAYRWEVIMRETVIVGVVGAAGLGRLIQDDLVARDFAAVTSTIGALVIMTIGASALSKRLRNSLATT